MSAHSTVWGSRWRKRFCNWEFPLLVWAAWQLQFSPAACGTLRKHVTKPFSQPAAPDCTSHIFTHTHTHETCMHSCQAYSLHGASGSQNIFEFQPYQTAPEPPVVELRGARARRAFDFEPLDGRLLRRPVGRYAAARARIRVRRRRPPARPSVRHFAS